LRDGRLVTTRPITEATLDQIVGWMVGRDINQAAPHVQRSRGAVALRVQGLRAPPAVRDVSFEVRHGEILGFAGLMGSGRTETVRAIFGADVPHAGEVFLEDRPSPTRIREPRDAVRQGIALLTEDRKSQGLLLPLSVRTNITLTGLNRLSRWKSWLRSEREQAEAARWVQALRVRCTSTEQPVAQLSGGNKQKVVMAKWLFRDSNVLIFDEPTRGIDVGAKFEIYERMAELARAGKALVVVSSDLKELLTISDRIAVMSAGRVVECFSRGDWTEEKIMAAALSGYLGPQASTS